MGTNLFLSFWCGANDPSNNNYYLTVYLILAITYGFFSLMRAALLCCKNIQVSRKLHYLMMRSLFLSSLNEFFERVPTGRILNRLSKDLTVVDGDIPFSIGYFDF
jgi:hypothetical protein